jgi:L-ascorbate metabolism protein UlaG (beta-lactamase superfamily)
MKIKRTANAGVLIEMNGFRILLDGVCEETEHYLGTPDDLKRELLEELPDAVGFTHLHSDHFLESYANAYKNKSLRPVLGSECSHLKVGNVSLRAIPTRHLGKSNTEHFSFIIEGERRIFFMGDASPSELKRLLAFGTPDILIVPFAYCNTESAWRNTLSSGAEEIILLHMPRVDADPYMLWNSVENTTNWENIRYFAKISETITLQ